MDSFWLFIIGFVVVLLLACAVEAVVLIRQDKRERQNMESLDEEPLSKTHAA